MDQGSISRKFLGWDRPLLDLATAKLAEDQGITDGILDFSKLMFLLPTGQSGRRFRENIAKFANARKAAVFPGRILSPSYLLASVEQDKNSANHAISFLTWVKVLKSARMSELSSLFPLEEEGKRDLRWSIGVAEKLLGLQNRLGEAGLTIEDVAGMEIEESDRWQDLSTLEQAFTAKLADAGLHELNREKRDLNEYEFPGIEKIIIAGVSDPIPLVLEKLKIIARDIPVEIWIHAPEEMSGLFDEFGRPLPEHWAEQQIGIPEEAWIHLAGGCESQGETVLQVLNQFGDELNADDIAICSANDELYSYIDHALAKYDIALYNPAGTTLNTMSVYHLLNTLSSLINKGDFESLSLLIRNPDFLKYLIGRTGINSTVEIFTAVDEYLVDHMSAPVPAADKLENEILKSVVTETLGLIEKFNQKGFFAFIRGILAEIYRKVEFSPHEKDADRIFCEAASLVDKLLKSLEGQIADEFADKELLEVFITLLGSQVVYPEKQELSLDLQGWLEMPWENAGNVIVAGMNEGLLPESIVGDIFLPDSLLRQLNLNDNVKRFARDTYILQSLIASRQEGAVHMIVGKRNRNNDPVKPSRLLFKCDKDKLVSRSKLLFSDLTDEEDKKLEFSALWHLDVPEIKEPIRKVSVTEFRNYLACPFRFYLKKCLKMEDKVYESNEMDAREFGSISHAVLEEFGHCQALNDSTDIKEIRAFLQEATDRQFQAKFGSNRPVPVMVQYESLLQRLNKFAEIQAREVAAGWRIIETELKLGRSDTDTMHGIAISGKVDRIEKNINTNHIRILDYKTIDSGDQKKLEPENQHVKKSNALSPEYAKFDFNGKEMSWIDLQLPLYALLLQKNKEYQDSQLECGYFILHKTISQTEVYGWDKMNDYLEEADKCVARVLDNLKQQIFWPPAEKVEYDDFEMLFAGFHNLEEAVGKNGGKRIRN